MPERDIEASSLESVSKIVSAFVSNNSVSSSELPQLIWTAHEALKSLDQTTSSPPEPAVPIKKSVTPDFVICLEDGKKLKMLKRHLKTSYGLTPDEYRERWGLPSDYPMVAPNYASQRSALAKKIGLGTKPRKRGRKRKA